jgi:hypothetical protein
MNETIDEKHRSLLKEAEAIFENMSKIYLPNLTTTHLFYVLMGWMFLKGEFTRDQAKLCMNLSRFNLNTRIEAKGTYFGLSDHPVREFKIHYSGSWYISGSIKSNDKPSIIFHFNGHIPQLLYPIVNVDDDNNDSPPDLADRMDRIEGLLQTLVNGLPKED